MTFPCPFMIPARAAKPLGIELVATDDIVGSATKYTFTDVNLGEEDANRIIAITFNGQGGSAISVGDTLLDAIAHDRRTVGPWGAKSYGIVLWQKNAGLLGDFEINFASSKNGCSIDVFAIYGADLDTILLPSSSLSSSSSSRSISVSPTAARSVSLASCVIDGTRTFTWTGATELSDRSSFGGNASQSAAGEVHESSGTKTFTAQASSSSSIALRAINMAEAS